MDQDTDDRLIDPGSVRMRLHITDRKLSDLVRTGVITAIVLPGSRIRRYRESEISRLIAGLPAKQEAAA